MFEDFDKISKEAWEAKVIKDLKGKPLSSLVWEIEEQLSAQPFYHADDFQTPPVPLALNASSNDWEIGESFTTSDIKDCNQKVRAALNAGVNAPEFILKRTFSKEDFSQLLEEVNPEIISLNFTLENEAILSENLKGFVDFLNQTNFDIQKISGSFIYKNAQPDTQWNEATQFCREHLPGFRLLTAFSEGNSVPSDALADAISQAYRIISSLSDQGISTEHCIGQFQFEVAIGKSFFVEIARLRALKLLWANLLNSFGLKPDTPVFITARFSTDAMDEDANKNMISAATIALSAAIGGANRLIVSPSGHANEAFSKRIARNVQHLLKMESFLDKVTDPGAGSYYIERVTRELGQIAWEKFTAKI